MFDLSQAELEESYKEPEGTGVVDLAARNYIEEKGYGQYFTHRTGHSIGLEDHEFGDVSSVNEDIIQVGQCIEPLYEGFDRSSGRIKICLGDNNEAAGRIEESVILPAFFWKYITCGCN